MPTRVARKSRKQMSYVRIKHLDVVTHICHRAVSGTAMRAIACKGGSHE
jgi:hypothetical protein